MYFLYGGCHSHPPALLCSKCRRQYCSPVTAWGRPRPPMRRTKKNKSQKPKTPTATKQQQQQQQQQPHYINNNMPRSKSSTGSLPRDVKSSSGSRSGSRSGSPTSGPQHKSSSPSTIVRKEPGKCKTFAEKLRSLLSCVA